MRTGEDALDGDTVAFEFADPAKIDPTTLRVLIVGEGASVRRTGGEYDLLPIIDDDDDMSNGQRSNSLRASCPRSKFQPLHPQESYGSTSFKWAERSALMASALEAAGVRVDVKTAAEAREMWSWRGESDPMFEGARTADLLRMSMAEAPWGQLMLDDLSNCNSRRCMASGLQYNLPGIAYTYARAAVVHFGRKFLNDPVWEKYDVIIDADAMLAGDYGTADLPSPHRPTIARYHLFSS